MYMSSSAPMIETSLNFISRFGYRMINCFSIHNSNFDRFPPYVLWAIWYFIAHEPQQKWFFAFLMNEIGFATGFPHWLQLMIFFVVWALSLQSFPQKNAIVPFRNPLLYSLSGFENSTPHSEHVKSIIFLPIHRLAMLDLSMLSVSELMM